MAEKVYYSTSKIIDGLIKAVMKYDFSAELLPAEEELNNLAIRELSISIGAHECVCFVDNEYGDAEKDNYPLLLNHIMTEFEEYDQVDDYTDWAKSYDLPVGSLKSEELWSRLQENQLEVRQITGSDLKTVSTFDFELDAHDAFYLRRLPAFLARPDLYVKD